MASWIELEVRDGVVNLETFLLGVLAMPVHSVALLAVVCERDSWQIREQVNAWQARVNLQHPRSL